MIANESRPAGNRAAEEIAGQALRVHSRRSPRQDRWCSVTAAARVIEAERAFVGALLLHRSADRAAHAAGLIESGDLRDPRLRVVHGLVVELAGQGVVPDPVAVLGRARGAGTVTTAHAVSALALLLADLYAECPLPAQVGYYAALVLDGSLRRRCSELGVRIGQAAETAALAELVGLLDAEVLAVAALRDRRAATLAGLGMPAEEVAA